MDINRHALNHKRFIWPLILMIAALALLLTGCGQLSLNQLLQNEDPGELRLSPAGANVPVDSVVDLQGKGGFEPYSYSKLSGGGVIDEQTGTYTAPGTADTVTIEVTDYFGTKSQGILEVFEQLVLLQAGVQVSHLTVALSALPITFTATGGVPPRVFSVEGTGSSIDGSGVFDAPAAGEYLVEVSDSIDNSAVATVTVLDVGGPLTIDPQVAYVLIGQTVDFTAYNYDAATFSFSVQAPASGSITAAVNPATYTPPAFETVDTIVLSDVLDTVTATVHVLTNDPDPLVITPASFSEDLKYGEEVVFTVSGGLQPYTFWLEYDGAHGTLEQISATKARYTAPEANTVDWVWVQDALETMQRVKTKVRN